MLNFSANVSLLFTETALINRFKVAKNKGFDAVEIQFPYELDASFLKKTLEQQQLSLVLFNVAADDLLTGGEGFACVPEKQDKFYEAVAQATEYANKRITDHLARFNYLHDAIRKNNIDNRYLTALEIMDNIFPTISFWNYLPSKKNN